MEATASHAGSRSSCGRRCTTRSASATRVRRSRCAAPPARSSAWASASRWCGDRPGPGLLTVFAYGGDDGTATVGVRAYLFSADAADWVRREEPGWAAWLQELAVPA
jgi:hypothetical protein